MWRKTGVPLRRQGTQGRQMLVSGGLEAGESPAQADKTTSTLFSQVICPRNATLSSSVNVNCILTLNLDL